MSNSLTLACCFFFFCRFPDEFCGFQCFDVPFVVGYQRNFIPSLPRHPEHDRVGLHGAEAGDLGEVLRRRAWLEEEPRGWAEVIAFAARQVAALPAPGCGERVGRRGRRQEVEAVPLLDLMREAA